MNIANHCTTDLIRSYKTSMKVTLDLLSPMVHPVMPFQGH
jgi:hypothetical protein